MLRILQKQFVSDFLFIFFIWHSARSLYVHYTTLHACCQNRGSLTADGKKERPDGSLVEQLSDHMTGPHRRQDKPAQFPHRA